MAHVLLLLTLYVLCLCIVVASPMTDRPVRDSKKPVLFQPSQKDERAFTDKSVDNSAKAATRLEDWVLKRDTLQLAARVVVDPD